MEIELRNVGIIKSAHLHFIRGLNLIVGASSSGKSTLLRAIRSMMDNTFTDSNISYGEKKLAVRMRYNDHSATYIRDLENTNRKSAYQVDGKVYTKIGRTSLEDLSALFKLAPVEIDGEKINFNFSAQFSGPFLLLGSASLLYSILTYRSSFDITKINDLYSTDLKNVKKDIDVLVKTKVTLEKEKEKKEKELSKLSNVPDLYTKVQILKNQNEGYNRIKDLYSSLKQAEKLKKENKKRIKTLSTLVKKVEKYNYGYSEYYALEQYTTYKGIHSRTGDRISKIKNILCNMDSLFNLHSHVSLLSNYMGTQKTINKTEKNVGNILQLLISLSSFFNLQGLVQTLFKYTVSKSRFDHNSALLHSLSIPDTDSLVTLNEYLMRVGVKVKTGKELGKIKESLNDVLMRIKGVGVCPLCQQPLRNF